MTELTTSKTDKPPTTGSTSTTTVVDDKHQGQFAVQQMMMFPFVKPIYDGDEVPPFDKSGGRRSVIGRALDHTTTDHGDILMIRSFQDIMKIIVCLYGTDKFLYDSDSMNKQAIDRIASGIIDLPVHDLSIDT